MTAVLDDHLLRDWLTGPDRVLARAIGKDEVATTNLWYARLCKSAFARRGGSLLGSWSDKEREALVGTLLALPSEVRIVPMRDLAWRMGVLVGTFTGLSTLGAEAIAATEKLAGRLVVSSRDDGLGIRACAGAVGRAYKTVAR